MKQIRYKCWVLILEMWGIPSIQLLHPAYLYSCVYIHSHCSSIISAGSILIINGINIGKRDDIHKMLAALK